MAYNFRQHKKINLAEESETGDEDEDNEDGKIF